MGKVELEELPNPTASPEPQVENADRICPPCRTVGKIVSLRCMAVLLVAFAGLLSAVFWLPPFFRGHHGGLSDLDDHYGADVVASFKLQKPVDFLNANAMKLQYDIFNEIGVPNTTVAVIDMDPLGTNSTNVVFGMLPYPKSSNISTGLSILKSSFVSLVLRQSILHLTAPLFGTAYFFQILKFPGGITIVPPQNAFLLQKEHMIFNFSLNFPIYQVQDKIDELKVQMKLGLHLTSYEILFVRLTNIKGSTMAPPTVVETSIVFAVGNNLPTVPRLKQLAQNIRNSSAGNLGLNHTTFGRVKQIRLSSFLQHSLNSSSGSSSSPSPAPQPKEGPHHHHHSHHHHNRHHYDVHEAPAPAPKPIITQIAPSPSGCHFRFSRNPTRKHQPTPVSAPAKSHHIFASPPIKTTPAPSPYFPPKPHIPAVIFAHAGPPSKSMTYSKPQNSAPFASPSSSPSTLTVPGQILWVTALSLFLWL